MFQSSFSSQCFMTVADEGTASHFMVVLPLQQNHLNDIPQWITAASRTEKVTAASQQTGPLNFNSARREAYPNRQQQFQPESPNPTNHRELNLQQKQAVHHNGNPTTARVLSTNEKETVPEEHLPTLCEDLIQRRCRSLPDLSGPSQNLSLQGVISNGVVEAPGADSDERVGIPECLLKSDWIEKRNLLKMRLKNPPSPNDRRLLKDAINRSMHLKNSRFSQVTRSTLPAVAELLESRSMINSNDTFTTGGRTEPTSEMRREDLDFSFSQSQMTTSTQIDNNEPCRAKPHCRRILNFNINPSVDLERSFDISSSRIHQSFNVNRITRSQSTLAALSDTRVASTSPFQSSANRTSSQVTFRVPETSMSVRRSPRKHPGTSTVNSPRSNANISIKIEKLTPEKRVKNPCVLIEPLSFRNRGLVSNVESSTIPINQTYVVNSLEVPYIGPVTNPTLRKTSKEAASYTVGDETQNACLMVGCNDMISPFSSNTSIACAQAVVPEIIARLASPSSNDVSNENALAETSIRSRELFVSPEDSSQNSSRAEALPISNHHQENMAHARNKNVTIERKRKHTPESSYGDCNIGQTVKRTRIANQNTINIVFNASQRRDMANLIFKMYK